MVPKTTTTMRPGLSGVDLEATVAHEGTHIVHWQKWAGSFDLVNSKWDLSKNDEYPSYQASNAVYARHQLNRNILGCKGCDLGIANKSLAEVDAAIKRILENSSLYHVTPISPGPRMDLNWLSPP